MNSGGVQRIKSIGLDTVSICLELAKKRRICRNLLSFDCSITARKAKGTTRKMSIEQFNLRIVLFASAPYTGMCKGQGRFKGKCRKCDKVGQKDPDCWEHEKHANKRPKNCKIAASRDTGMAAADDSDIKFFMLCSVVKTKREFSSKEKFQISNLNIVIADTRASVNGSGNADSMTNNRATATGVNSRCPLQVKAHEQGQAQAGHQGPRIQGTLWSFKGL